MNIIDKIKSVFTREKSGVITQYMGTGISANYNGNMNYGSGSKYNSGMSASKTVMIHDHFSLRQAARDSMYDSTVARAIVDRFADTIVDTGLKLKPVPNPEILGIEPEKAEEWAENVAAKFHLWAKSKKSHRSRVNNFYQNQHLYQKFQQRDNDIFVKLFYSREKDLFNPLQIDFVEPNQIRGYSYTSSYANGIIDDGIIRDAGGREIGYKVWEFDGITGKYTEKTIPAIGEKSGRIFMLHGFNPEYAGQGRGYSRLTHALQEFEKLTDFTLSTIQKGINQAGIVMAIENELQDSSNPLAGRVAGPVAQYGANPIPDPSAQNVTPDSTQPIINYTSMPEATMTTPGSTGVFNLRRGDKLKYLADTSPSAQYNSFVEAFCSYLCASVGMPIELLLMKFNANYSASRASLILFWRVAQIWRDEMAADFLDPVYEMWLSEEIAAGRVVAPGWNDPLLRAAWLNCEWAGAPMPSIDPGKMAEADKLYVEMGAQTLDDVARNYNGSSGKANRIKNARQFKELAESPFQKVQQPANNQDEKDQDNNDNEDNN